MKRRKRSHPNWPLRWFMVGVIAVLIGSTLTSTILTVDRSNWGRSNPYVWNTALLNRLFEVFFGFWFFSLGACVGSFLNVVAWRMPRGFPITGFSRCPYCQVGILGQDNIPLLGWLNLRGRCRKCRLPISRRYPTFELIAGILFLVVYLGEVLPNGRNLPKIYGPRLSNEIIFGQIEWDIVLRCLAHLWLLTFLFAGCLIRLDRQRIPLRLISFAVASWSIMHMIWPNLIIVPWQWTTPPATIVATNWDALIWLLCGATTGLILGMTVYFMNKAAYRIRQQYDPTIVVVEGPINSARTTQQPESTKPDAISIVGMMLLAGVGFGWQATISIFLILSMIVLAWQAISAATRMRVNLDPSAWVWLAATIQLLTWSLQQQIWFWPNNYASPLVFSSVIVVGLIGLTSNSYGIR